MTRVRRPPRPFSRPSVSPYRTAATTVGAWPFPTDPQKVSTSTKTWRCTACHAKHEVSGYVFAHWNETLIHTCECGSKHSIHSGRILRCVEGEPPREPIVLEDD